MPSPKPLEDEANEAPRREILYAVLALVSLLIGISRLVDAAPAPLWVKVLDAGIALAFLADWARRVVHAKCSGRYAFRHGYEVLTFVPFTLLPATFAGGDVLRSARLVRIVRFARYGRYAKVGLSVARLPNRARYLRRVAHNAQLVTILLVGILTVATGGAALLYFEGGAASLTTYSSALWWSLNMFTNVGYAVPSPKTPAGYAVTGSLMVLGLAYIGVFTASLASALLRTDDEHE